MNLKRLILIAIIGISLAWMVKAYAGSVSMVTYYPSPTGNYLKLSASKELVIPCYAAPPNGISPNSIFIISGNCP